MQTRSRKRRLDHDRATAELRYLVTIRELDQEGLTLHAGAIAAFLTDAVPFLRKAAAEALGNLHPDKLVLHTGAIVGVLADAEYKVRYAAIMTLRRLDHAAFTRHADAIANLLIDANWLVRSAAVVALGELHPEELVFHTGAIVSILTDPEARVRMHAVETICRIDQAALTQHTNAIAALLTDAVPFVRCAAVKALGKLHPATLALHTGAITDAIFDLLADGDWEIRLAAYRLIDPQDELGMLPPDALAWAISVVKDTVLTERHVWVRDKAIRTLRALKRKRARLHWATARVYRVRRYGRFWYEDVVVKLCAPGGVWAERDRAAFEAEFI